MERVGEHLDPQLCGTGAAMDMYMYPIIIEIIVGCIHSFLLGKIFKLAN